MVTGVVAVRLVTVLVRVVVRVVMGTAKRQGDGDDMDSAEKLADWLPPGS